ncbi:MAG TPA: alternative ribosome rescue aminoacyl-tRNA hydrolase ArfB, partial [Tepidisphaeraceae bacterium]|nr:alternative ribosome rescue aminoacyl-tRNA hydrolase ArfB [Tepidisphaeraceae bacterium]
ANLAPETELSLGAGATVPRAAVRWQYARSSGPGGQNVNKVNTKAELWVAVGDIAGLTDAARGRLRQFAGKRLTDADEVHVAADDARSQEGNRQSALARLAELVAKAAHEPKVRRKTKPSRGARRRRLESKRHRSEVKARRREGF